jgi:long-subunit fatty acid transport protein
MVGSYLSTQQDFNAGSSGYSFSDEEVSRGDLNYASVAYPFRVFGKNLVAALNYQQIYDFHSDIKFNQSEHYDDGFFVYDRNIDTVFNSQGGVGALTPAVSGLIMPKLSIGVAVNFYTDEFFDNYAWKETYRSTSSVYRRGNTSSDTYDSEMTYKNFQAVNAAIGVLWDVWEKEDKLLTFGAVYKTPYTAGFDRITETNTESMTNGKLTKFTPTHNREHFETVFPMSLGAGLGFRYNDALSFSSDVTWTDWSEWKQTDENGVKVTPLGSTRTSTNANDTYSIKCGSEYLIFGKKVIVPVRGGVFYDPRPSLRDPTDVYGFSVGSGITFKRFSLDGAYQFRWANNVDGEDIGLSGTHYDLKEHIFLTSIIVYF